MLPEIPFNRPCLTGNELLYVGQAIANGHISSNGYFTERARDLLKSRLGAPAVLLTTSCTDALEMTALLSGVGPGDVVILPSFTFSSTATAFARQGASLRFCDIRFPDLGLDPEHVEQSLDSRVKAIVTVHYAGVASDVQRLKSIADQHGILLIEDNAHGLFATHEQTQLGRFGEYSTLSFHETKNFTCGEGGALVINNSEAIESAQILLDKGTNRKQFLEGLTDKYTWYGNGSSFGLSDILAAFLLAQLESSDVIQASRRRVHETYVNLLRDLSQTFDLTLPFQRPEDKPADHMFYLLLPSADIRPLVIQKMREQGVHPTFHYVPLHSSPGALRFADRYEECPISDDVSRRILRLPFYNDLTANDQERVVASLELALNSLQTT